MSIFKNRSPQVRAIFSYALALLLFVVGLYFGEPKGYQFYLLNPYLIAPALIFTLCGLKIAFCNKGLSNTSWKRLLSVLAGLVILLLQIPILFSFLLAFSPV